MMLSLNISTLRAGYASGTLTPESVLDQVYDRITAMGEHPVWITLLPKADALARLAAAPKGLLSTRGVVPAYRSQDCVSIFAATVADAHAVLKAAAGYDIEDAYSRKPPAHAVVAPPPAPHRATACTPWRAPSRPSRDWCSTARARVGSKSRCTRWMPPPSAASSP